MPQAQINYALVWATLQERGEFSLRVHIPVSRFKRAISRAKDDDTFKDPNRKIIYEQDCEQLILPDGRHSPVVVTMRLSRFLSKGAIEDINRMKQDRTL